MCATWQERRSPSVNYGFCLLHTTSSYMYARSSCVTSKAGKLTALNNVRPMAFWGSCEAPLCQRKCLAYLKLKVQKLIYRHSMRICIYVCFLFPFCVNISEPGGSPKIVIMIQFAQFISYQLLQRHAKIFIKRQKYS